MKPVSPDRLARLELLAAEFAAIVAELRAEEVEPEHEMANSAHAPNFEDCDLIPASKAAQEFGLPKDKCRRWIREGLGTHVFGRPMASVSMFRRRLGLV